MRNAIVTGASSGIGHAIATMLIADGHNVVGIARQTDSMPEGVEGIAMDLADLEHASDRLGELAKKHSQTDTLILCAGAGRFGALEQFSPAQIRGLIDLNITSQLLLLRCFIPRMKSHASGNVILMGSEAALKGHRNGAVYCATKFAVRGLAQALREECAPARVHVTVVNPGMVDTPFFESLDFAPGESPENAIEATDVAAAVRTVLEMRPGTVVDEINLSPLKHVVRATRS